MALFDILLPQLMNCRQQCGQAYENLMDQDWNHWKLQVQSWMEDAKEQSATHTGAATGAQPCGSAANRSHCRRNRCNRTDNEQTQDVPNPMDFLQGMWTQFARPVGQQTQSNSGEQDLNNLVKDGQKKFVIKLDVQHFEPNELTVKIVGNDIVVTGEHPERTDRLGRISRQFQRKYEVPADVEPESIISTLTASGVLIIEGLKKSTPNESGAEIMIPVIREGTDVSTNAENSYENEQQMD